MGTQSTGRSLACASIVDRAHANRKTNARTSCVRTLRAYRTEKDGTSCRSVAAAAALAGLGRPGSVTDY